MNTFVLVHFTIFTLSVLSINVTKNAIENVKIVPNGLRRKLALIVLKSNPNRTMAMSPLALRFPLCKLASVAQGDALKELRYVLGLTKPEMVRHCYPQFRSVLDISKETDLMLFNKIYVPYTRNIEPQFVANSMKLFGVNVEKVGFNFPKSAVTFINRWVNSATLHRIPNILDVKDLDKNTTMLIISAIHFKGTWEEKFDIRDTVNGKFRHIDNNISNVPMMMKHDHYDYLNNDDCQILMMKLASYATSMLFVVPKSVKDLPRVIKIMFNDPDWIKNAKARMKRTLVRVSIPRFKIKSEVDWTEYLKEIGVRKIFNRTNSGLNRMLTRNSTLKNIILNKAKQKIFMDVDELGVARHVQDDEDYRLYTPLKMYGFNMEEFTADKPFYFEVNMEVGNKPHLLICGVYYGPD